MHSLLKFILRYSNFLAFLALEVVAFMLVVNNQDYPHSHALSTANTIVGWQYKIVDEIESYFRLRSINEDLSAENARLHALLHTQTMLHEDSMEIVYSQTSPRSQIQFIPGKVVEMTTHKAHNYLTINKGSQDGVHEGMGVINHDGVVGIVRTVGEYYSVVIPIINTQTAISSRIQKNGYIGTIEWDGINSHYAQLSDIASHIQVQEGDTIVTSGLTPIFPKDIPVGVIESCHIGSGDSYYTIRVRLMTDYKRLEYIQIINNPMATQQISISNGMD